MHLPFFLKKYKLVMSDIDLQYYIVCEVNLYYFSHVPVLTFYVLLMHVCISIDI